MLTKRLERRFPGTISDVILGPSHGFAALGSSLAIFDTEQVQITRRLPVPVYALVANLDGPSVLAISAVLSPSQPAQQRRVTASENSSSWRRVFRLAEPTAALEDLGDVKADGISATWDGSYWSTYEGDTVYLFRYRQAGLTAEELHETFLPTHVELLSQRLWLEHSSIGAEHFQLLALPDLRSLASGDLEHCDLDFPSEVIPFSAQTPTLSQPIFAVRSLKPSLGTQRGGLVTTAECGSHRIVTLDNRVVAWLANPATGLVAAGDRALAWVESATGLDFLYIGIRSAQVLGQFSIAGATKASARFFGRSLAVWADETLHLYCELDD